MERRNEAGQNPCHLAHGFSLLEVMVALIILLGVTSIVMSGMMQMTLTQGTISNRTEMHSSVRSATEVLQQEIGQAGKIALPSTGPTHMTTAVVMGTDPNVPVTVVATLDSVDGVYNGMLLVVDTGDNEETVTVSNLAVSTKQFTGVFSLPHVLNLLGWVPVRIDGIFSSGIVPTNYTVGGTNYGSDGFHLKLYGDINDDGNMVYIEYYCDTAGGNLYRSVTSYTSAAPGTNQVILPNLIANPSNAPCFQYQEFTKAGSTYDTDVAVTLTVQTQQPDPQTHVVQQETKALLNVSPRNIYDGYQLAAAGVANRVQPMPPTVTALIQLAP